MYFKYFLFYKCLIDFTKQSIPYIKFQQVSFSFFFSIIKRIQNVIFLLSILIKPVFFNLTFLTLDLFSTFLFQLTKIVMNLYLLFTHVIAFALWKINLISIIIRYFLLRNFSSKFITHILFAEIFVHNKIKFIIQIENQINAKLFIQS